MSTSRNRTRGMAIVAAVTIVVWVVASTRMRMGERGSQKPTATKSRLSSNTMARSPGAPSWETEVIEPS